MKLTVVSQCCVSEEIRAHNTALSKGYPPPSGSGHLAVVGGGPSVTGHLDQLRAWPGDIWAINGAAQWCIGNSIDALLYSVDPGADLGPMCEGVSRAVFATHCDPSAYEAMRGKTVYQVSPDVPGPTSAVGATVLAIEAGYRKVTFFGCESSYTDTTHAYNCEIVDDLIRVECGGETYLTKPEFLAQAEQLANAIRAFPQFYDDLSGGLLSALIDDPDYDLVGVSRSLYETMGFKETRHAD